MEATFVNTNAAATLKLGQARGIAMLVPAKAGLAVAEYAPNLVKKTIVGAGHGEKAQIRMMIGVLLPKADPQSEDAADALAIAVCHAHHRTSAAAEGGGVMIGKLKGIIDSYGEDYVILDVGGVGYQVHCSARTLQALPAPGEPATLSIETYVREDQIKLFGFASDIEREWFRLLQTVQGVGAKVALSVLGTLKASELASAIAMRDKATVARAPGVGPKVAERIVTELKDKAPAFADIDPAVVHLAGALDEKRAPQPGGGRGLRAGQSRLRPAAGRRRDCRRRAQRGRGRRHRDVDPAGPEGAGEDEQRAAPPCRPPRTRDDDADASLRPQRLAEFIGQEQARANLEVFIEAARARKEALDHVLFVGPPGLGKTTLAQIVARELGVNFRATSGPVIAKAGDLAALLTNLEPRDVLFIDEIHRLNPAVEEILYPAMEDFQLDLIIGEGPAARSVKIDLAPFTLVGATTRAGLLTNPLRDRFGIPVRLNFYTEAELEQIVNRGARVLGLRHDRRRRQRDRAARARHPAHRRPAAAARARLRPCRGRRRPSTARSPTARCRRWRSTPPGSTPWTGAISDHRRRITAAARSASRRSPRRCRSRATPSRTSSSRF